MKGAISLLTATSMMVGGFGYCRGHEHDLKYCLDRVEEKRWAVVEVSCQHDWCDYIEMVDIDLYQNGAVPIEDAHSHQLNYECTFTEDLGRHTHSIIEVTCNDCNYTDMIESWRMNK